MWAKNVLKRFLGAVVSTLRFNRNGPAVETIKKFLNNMKVACRVFKLACVQCWCAKRCV